MRHAVRARAVEPADAFLYERLADELGALVARGALRPGDRLPSVRRLSEERGVSVATVLSAYLLLEGRGVAEARPKSGHFVRARRAADPPVPSVPRRAPAPARVTIAAGVDDLIRAMTQARSLVPLGAASIAAELLPLRKLNAALAAVAREGAGPGAMYDELRGNVQLRRQLARRAVSWGAFLEEDDFVTTVGATEALHLSLRVVTKPGDIVAVESPAYFALLRLVESAGLRAIEIPSDPRTGLDLDALEDAVRSAPVRAVLATPNFSNPLGARMPDEHKERLVRMLARRDIPLIEDDVYGDLAFDGTRPRPAKAFDTGGNVLLCGSISKTLAPGYRVGWVAPGKYRDAVERLKFAHCVSSPTPTQMAVAELLAEGGYDRHVRKLRRILAGQSERRHRAGADLLGAPALHELHPHQHRAPVVAAHRARHRHAGRARARALERAVAAHATPRARPEDGSPVRSPRNHASPRLASPRLASRRVTVIRRRTWRCCASPSAPRLPATPRSPGEPRAAPRAPARASVGISVASLLATPSAPGRRRPRGTGSPAGSKEV